MSPDRTVLLFAAALGSAASACARPSDEGATGTTRAADQTDAQPAVAVLWSDVHQRIRGFGAASAWTAPDLSDQQADTFFSADAGIGLSLVRLRIAPDGTTGETATALKAQARGAAVWATPWSPPGEWKSNGSVNDGGSLLPEHYQDWAASLAAFAVSMQSQGVQLLAVSAQNEPNWSAPYESCVWAPADLATFVTSYLTPALQAAGSDAGVVAPETINWATLTGYADPILASDGGVLAIATHSYGGSPFAYPGVSEAGAEFWETEVSDPVATADPGMDSALRIAIMMHAALTVAEVNVWQYWWLLPVSDVNSALVLSGSLSRRGYAMGNFSRWVRPGWVRIGAQPDSPQSGVYVTAYRDPTATQLVIVAINENSAAAPQTFTLSGVPVVAVTPWVTDDNVALQASAPVPALGSFSYDLGPRSITTFVGTPAIVLPVEAGADAADGAAQPGDGGEDDERDASDAAADGRGGRDASSARDDYRPAPSCECGVAHGGDGARAQGAGVGAWVLAVAAFARRAFIGRQCKSTGARRDNGKKLTIRWRK
jgi:glucuronoarabinoxylan endo-1,4-beta-xylanase